MAHRSPTFPFGTAQSLATDPLWQKANRHRTLARTGAEQWQERESGQKKAWQENHGTIRKVKKRS
jgi:hypothetical protein